MPDPVVVLGGGNTAFAIAALRHRRAGESDQRMVNRSAIRAKFNRAHKDVAGHVAVKDDIPVHVFMTRTRHLGVRHRGYGVTAEHYRLMGDALLGALAEQCSDWTPELAEAWSLAYNLTTEAMMLEIGRAHV